MLCIFFGLGESKRAMNATRMFETYAERAKAATCPVCRAVNMLGMMAAAAIDNGGFLAFVGQGYGGDWPDPREVAEQPPRDSGSVSRGFRR
jgi:hypothetical protein